MLVSYKYHLIGSFFLTALFFSGVTNAEKSAEQLYKRLCIACHGPELTGSFGSSLVDDEWKHGATDADIAKVIKEGVIKKGMPPMGRSLSDEQITAMVVFIREKGKAASKEK